MVRLIKVYEYTACNACQHCVNNAFHLPEVDKRWISKMNTETLADGTTEIKSLIGYVLGTMLALRKRDKDALRALRNHSLDPEENPLSAEQAEASGLLSFHPKILNIIKNSIIGADLVIVRPEDAERIQSIRYPAGSDEEKQVNTTTVLLRMLQFDNPDNFAELVEVCRLKIERRALELVGFPMMLGITPWAHVFCDIVDKVVIEIGGEMFIVSPLDLPPSRKPRVERNV